VNERCAAREGLADHKSFSTRSFQRLQLTEHERK
jgi:hypothetical protein